MRERQRRAVCKRLEAIEEELAAQLLDSYAGTGPVEFWAAVESFKLFVESPLRLTQQPGTSVGLEP